MGESAGKKFREALAKEKPLQIMGTINAYCAMMAKKAGFEAIYLSGGACANRYHQFGNCVGGCETHHKRMR